MKRISVFILVIYLITTLEVQGQRTPIGTPEGLTEASWESLNERGYPQWFCDAKLGIFIHWGLYSVPAYASKEGYGEWFYRGLMVGDSGRCHIMRQYADPTLPLFQQYQQLTHHWNAELWSPNEWADLFTKAGARYVVLVTKHHDGYCLWDSPQQPQWNSTMSGPHRNIVEELTEAVRKKGLRMGMYYSLLEWTNERHIWMEDSDDSIGNYVENYMIPQFKDLVTRYRPDLIFSDGDWNNSAEQLHSTELISWYYNTVGPDAIVNNRWGRGTQHGFITPEYSAGIRNFEVPWAECRGLGRSFGLNRNEDLANYLTSTELIQHFAFLVSGGGGMTLNVGPAADGTIPMIQQERLLDLGRWLRVNGEAIYGCQGAGDEPMQQTLQQRTLTIDYNWVRNAPERSMTTDHFSAHWQGIPIADEPGTYTIEVEADDEIIVMAGRDTLIHFIKDDPTHQQRTATMTMDQYYSTPWHIYYNEQELEAVARLLWHRSDERKFYPIAARSMDGTPGWQVEYRWMQTVRCFTKQADAEYIIEFRRPRNQVVLDHYSKLPKGSTITMLGTSSSSLRWKQKSNGQLIIDLRSIPDTELNALEHAFVFCIKK